MTGKSWVRVCPELDGGIASRILWWQNLASFQSMFQFCFHDCLNVMQRLSSYTDVYSHLIYLEKIETAGLERNNASLQVDDSRRLSQPTPDKKSMDVYLAVV